MPSPRIIVRVGVLVLVVLMTAALAYGVRWQMGRRDGYLREIAQMREQLQRTQDRLGVDLHELDSRLTTDVQGTTGLGGYLMLDYESRLTRLTRALQLTRLQVYSSRIADQRARQRELAESLSTLIDTHSQSSIPLMAQVSEYHATASAAVRAYEQMTVSLPVDVSVYESTIVSGTDLIADLQSHVSHYTRTIHDYRVSQLKTTLSSIITEVDTYVGYFASHGDELGLSPRLAQIQARAQSLMLLYPDLETLGEIESELAQDMYPTIARAKTQYDAIIAREREEYERKLAELARVQSVVPEAPVKEGKVIFISIAAQRLYAYDEGRPVFDYAVPVTTGKKKYETVTGEYAIYHKTTGFTMRSPFPDDPYVLYVQYWMPFFEGFGFHDAPWRSVFGGPDYTWNGSHGCINMRTSEVARIYDWAPIGTKVIVR